MEMTAGASQTGLPELPMQTDLAHLTTHDEALATKIMRKRQEELARRSRLQDPRRRQFGVSHDVLGAQVMEKRAAAEQEAHADDDYQTMAAAQDHILNCIELMKEKNRRDKHKEVLDFSAANLSKEQRREYSLSDPKQYTSAYTTQPYDQLGPSSMTKFEGEAIDVQGKKRLQRETAAVLQQQMQEKRDREQAERDWDRFHDQRMAEANKVLTHCEAATLQEIKEDKEEESRDNVTLAQLKREQLYQKCQREARERDLHSESVRNSDLLTERHDYKVGTNGKLQKGEYKRLTIDEEAHVYNTNANLYMQKKTREREEAEADRAHHTNTMNVVSIMSCVEEQQAQLLKERNRKIIEENRRLAEEKRKNDVEERRKYLSFHYEP